MQSEAALLTQFRQRMKRLMGDSDAPRQKAIEAAACLQAIEALGKPPCLLDMYNEFAVIETVSQRLARILRQWARSN